MAAVNQGGSVMPTYVNLFTYTQRGIEHIKEAPKRLEVAKRCFAGMGAQLKEFYLVMGRYDIVTISEAPNDETMTRVALTFGALGNVRSETLRAFTEEEYRRIVADVPLEECGEEE
jgi:uncharacterized protein with GYD domain